MFGRLYRLLLTTTALVPLGLPLAHADPLGAQVVSGSASVQGQGTASVTVTQATDKAIINWNSFNIGSGEKTQFIQPTSSSVALNRVTGGLGPSQIFGSLTANGRLFVVNPDGILIGSGAKIDTAGFLATTHDIANADFMAGRYNFSISGNPTASVVNQGTITAQSGGFAALVAPGVRNTGAIAARLGKVALAVGNGFSLDLYGDQLITLGVSDSIAATVKDVSTGQSLSSLVSNEGKLKANGGVVQLSAVAARRIVDSVINTKGVIEANTIGKHNGMIVLGAATAKTKPADAPTQTVSVSGTLSAAGKREGRTGGTVQVTGENIVLAGATVDASGQAGGGTVLIGGDTGGGNPDQASVGIAKAKLESSSVPTASAVRADATTIIDVSAKDTGDGGKAVVWSDGLTAFNGTIAARAGARGGNGGFVETSGNSVEIAGARISALAPRGTAGLWLIDPYDLLIDSTAASVINASLATSNVTVETAAAGYSGPGTVSAGSGDIAVGASINWNTDTTLTLSAYHDIYNLPFVIVSNTGNGNLILRADNTGAGSGTVNLIGSLPVVVSLRAIRLFDGVVPPPPRLPAVDFSRSGGAVTVYYNPTFGYVFPTNYSSVIATHSAAQLTAYMLVNNVNDLQSISQNLSGNYALGKNVDASVTAAWNGGAGFAPLGYFSGKFDGQSHTIDGLVIRPGSGSSLTSVGLFQYLTGGPYCSCSTAEVHDVRLTNVFVDGPAADSVGSLAGWSEGNISNVFVSGSVSGSASTLGGGFAGGTGGLFGISGGPISNAVADVTVSGSANTGGLIGASDSVIHNSLAKGSVIGTDFVGGLVGYFGGLSSAIIDSQSMASVAGHNYVGGLTGINAFSYSLGAFAFIQRSTTGGNVNGDTYVGGLTGLNSGLIVDSYASGNVTGVSQVGGLVGRNDNTIISLANPELQSSYASGNVSGTTNVGGLVGVNDTAGIVVHSYASGSVTGTSNFNALVGADSGVTSQSAGTTVSALRAGLPLGFDPAVWAIDGAINYGLPYLQWQTIFPPPAPSPPGVVPPTPSPPGIIPPTGSESPSSIENVPSSLSQFFTQAQIFSFPIVTTVANSTPSVLPSSYPVPSVSNKTPALRANPSDNITTGSIVSVLQITSQQIPPLGQLSASSYLGAPTDPSEACYATTYTMIARWAGDPEARINGTSALSPTFTSNNGLSIDGLLTKIDLERINATQTSITAALNKGSLIIIDGSIPNAAGGTESHAMLATGLYNGQSNKVIANDPLTGTRLVIEYDQEHANGYVAGILDPNTQRVVSFDSPSSIAIVSQAMQNAKDIIVKGDPSLSISAQYEQKATQYISALTKFTLSDVVREATKK